MQMGAALLFLFLGLSSVSAYDAVGWYVGTDTSNTTGYPLEKLDWDLYTSIRGPGIVVADDGTASCPTDPFFKELLAVARKHGKTLTLGWGSQAKLDPYQCYANASWAGKCQKYLQTVAAAVLARMSLCARACSRHAVLSRS